MEKIDGELNFSQGIRRKIVEKICGSSDLETMKMPDDRKDMALLLEVSRAMDSQTISIKKIASDEGINNKQLVAAETIAQIFNTRNVKELAKGDVIDGEIKVLDESLPTAEIVHGEIIETPALDYDKFIGQFEKK